MMAPNDENLEIVSALADNSQLSPVTLQDESEEHRKQRLKNAVDGLLASYGKYPEIERIGTTPLPTKENIVRLVEGIQVLLFPGLIRQERFDSLNLPYAMGQRTTTGFEQLQEYIEEVLCWEYSQGGEDCHQRRCPGHPGRRQHAIWSELGSRRDFAFWPTGRCHAGVGERRHGRPGY